MFQDRRGYWYRSKRIGGRVVREYVGRGEWCAAAAQLDQFDRQSEAATKAGAQAQRAKLEAIDREAQAAFDAVTAAMNATLRAAGYRQHARGQWRKRRAVRQSEVKDMATQTTLAKATPAKKAETDLSTLDTRALLALSRKGDAAALKELFQGMEPEHERALVEAVVAPGETTVSSVIALWAPRDALEKECYRRKMIFMRDDMAGPDASPLELQLASRVALCWLQVNYWETLFAQRVTEGEWKAAEIFSGYLDKAHKRHLSAIKSLAQVRKLQLPTVQVNIGEKQVNIAQMNASCGET